MGLFSFLKKAGSNLFGGNDKAVEVDRQEEERKNAEQAAILKRVAESQGFGIKGLQVNFDGDKATIYGEVDSQSQREKVVLAMGNVAGVAIVDDRMTVSNPEPEATFYEVKKGDSLSKIAKEVYGDAMKYPAIFEANKPMLSDPDKIYPGQVLRIPPK